MPSSAIPDSPRSVWVVGSGGFLGGAVAEQLERDGRFHVFQPRPHLEWSAPDFTSAIDAFQAHTSGMPWTVVWAAGAATVNSSEPEARDEAMSFREFLDQLRLRMNLRVGTVVLASSAGGVYAGSHQSVISINTPAATASPYGRLKVEQEELVRSLEDDGLTVRIVRITNLFGPRSAYRSSGSFAVARWITFASAAGTAGLRPVSGGSAACSVSAITSWAARPRYGRASASNS